MDRPNTERFGQAFQSAINPAFLFPAAGQRFVQSTIAHAIRSGNSICVLTGPAGSGKTLLARAIAEDLRPERQAVVIGMSRGVPPDLPDAVLAGLGMASEGWGRGKSLRSLRRFLRNGHARDQRFLLILDDAERLSRQAFDQLLRISDLQIKGEPLLPILLVGDTDLETRLEQRELHDVQNRVCGPFLLPGFARDDIAPYLAHRLNLVGHDCNADSLPFDDDSIDALFDKTQGLPLALNTLATRALVEADRRGTGLVDADLVRDVATNISDRPATSQEDALILAPVEDAAPQDALSPVGSVSPFRAAMQSEATPTPRPRKLRGLWLWSAAALGVLAAGVILLPSSRQNDAGVPEAKVAPQAPLALAAPEPAPASTRLPLSALPRPAGISTAPDAKSILQQALDLGVEDPEAAILLYERAALWGNERAAYYLGQFYESGLGVPADPLRARGWYKMAGHIEGAKARLEALPAPDAVEGELSAPLPVMQAVYPDGRAELHWRKGEGVGPARFAIEYRIAGEGETPQRRETDLTAISIEGPIIHWRVIGLGENGAEGEASSWSRPIPGPR